jgi:hypothetical protein
MVLESFLHGSRLWSRAEQGTTRPAIRISNSRLSFLSQISYYYSLSQRA